MNSLIQSKIHKNSKASKLTYSLYEESFPAIEKLPFRMLHKYNKKGKVDFIAYYDEEKYIGFSYVMLTKKSAYLLLCATVPSERSRGYGSKIIETLCSYYKDRYIVLDVEPLEAGAPNYEQRKKRIDFYERNGFYLSPYYMEDSTGRYAILCNSKDLDIEDFKTSFKLFPPFFEGTVIKENK